jgi:tRNA1(Val) A37 N6-methylase TrmN6
MTGVAMATALSDRTDDAFLGGSLSILQPARGYRSGIDAVLLAAAAPVVAGAAARVLDAGSGVGVVGLGIARRVPDAHVVLVEIDPGLAALARENAARNGLGSRVAVIEADILRGGATLHDPARPVGLDAGRFDHVVANPPYFATGEGRAPAVPHRAAAHQMAADGLDRWIAFLATAAAAGGSLTMVHRAEALGAILSALGGRFGGVRVLPLHPREGAAAHRILVQAFRGSRAPLTLLPGLPLAGADGRYLPAIEAVLRGRASLDLTPDHGQRVVPMGATDDDALS